MLSIPKKFGVNHQKTRSFPCARLAGYGLLGGISFSLSNLSNYRLQEDYQLKNEQFKALTASVKEMSKDHIVLGNSLKATATSANATKGLWKSGHKPLLIQAGLALIVFPEPIVSDALGTFLLAAGAVQEGIKRQAVYVDDLPKAFQSAMRTLKNTKDLV